MKKLLKSYGLTEPYEYYDICIMSVINGQRTQAREQINALSKQDKKDLYNYCMAQDECQGSKETAQITFNLI